jgi:hypothetical protein
LSACELEVEAGPEDGGAPPFDCGALAGGTDGARDEEGGADDCGGSLDGGADEGGGLLKGGAEDGGASLDGGADDGGGLLALDGGGLLGGGEDPGAVDDGGGLLPLDGGGPLGGAETGAGDDGVGLAFDGGEALAGEGSEAGAAPGCADRNVWSAARMTSRVERPKLPAGSRYPRFWSRCTIPEMVVMGSSHPIEQVKVVPSPVNTRVTVPCETGTAKPVVPSAWVVRPVSSGSSLMV